MFAVQTRALNCRLPDTISVYLASRHIGGRQHGSHEYRAGRGRRCVHGPARSPQHQPERKLGRRRRRRHRPRSRRRCARLGRRAGQPRQCILLGRPVAPGDDHENIWRRWSSNRLYRDVDADSRRRHCHDSDQRRFLLPIAGRLQRRGLVRLHACRCAAGNRHRPRDHRRAADRRRQQSPGCGSRCLCRRGGPEDHRQPPGRQWQRCGFRSGWQRAHGGERDHPHCGGRHRLHLRQRRLHVYAARQLRWNRFLHLHAARRAGRHQHRHGHARRDGGE